MCLGQALLEPFCRAAAHTKRPALLARLQDGVFGELLQAGSAGALANLDMRSLGTKLFDLGEPCCSVLHAVHNVSMRPSVCFCCLAGCDHTPCLWSLSSMCYWALAWWRTTLLIHRQKLCPLPLSIVYWRLCRRAARGEGQEQGGAVCPQQAL